MAIIWGLFDAGDPDDRRAVWTYGQDSQALGTREQAIARGYQIDEQTAKPERVGTGYEEATTGGIAFQQPLGGSYGPGQPTGLGPAGEATAKAQGLLPPTVAAPTAPVTAAPGAGTTGPGPYQAFNTAFKRLLGREITQAEQENNEFVSKLSNELVRLLPPDRLRGMSLGRLTLLTNDDLISLVPDLIPLFPNERLGSFGKDYLSKIITDAQRRAELGLEAAAAAPGPGPAPAPGPGPAPAPGLAPPPTPAPLPYDTIPDTHAWVMEIGANEWAQKLRRDKVDWKDITLTRLRSDMAAVWATRKSDPKFAASYRYAQEYYARQGYWPTEVEYNRFTQNLPAPALSPDGTSFIPKTSKKADGEGDFPQWEVPTRADGSAVPLPPSYEWRFSSDGTPIPYFTGTAAQKDVFAGWYQDPKTGNWSYNPFLGAADYLSGGDQRWSDLIGGYAAHTGRLPDRDAARQLSLSLWQGADPATKARAEQFALANGFWPTPFELEYGASTDTDANQAGTGAAGQAGLGQVPVFVPGVGVVLTQGQAISGTGFVFDPMSGIPGSVRPWVREILNGRMTLDGVPAEVRDWAIFSLAKFKEQLPTKRLEELKLAGVGNTAQPSATPWGAPMPVSLLDEPLNRAAFLSSWKQLMPPGTAEPTTAQMNDVGWLSTLDSKITQHLSSATLRQFPLDALATFGNEVLINKVPDIILKFPNERLGTFGKDYLNTVVTDVARRAELGLPAPQPTKPAETAAKPAAPAPVPPVTQPTPAVGGTQLTPPPTTPAPTTLPSAPMLGTRPPITADPYGDPTRRLSAPPIPMTLLQQPVSTTGLLPPPVSTGALPQEPAPSTTTGLLPPPETEEERRRRLGL